MMGGTVREITKDFENEENQKNEGIKTPSNNSNNNKKKHTGAKVVISTISILTLVGLAATVGVDYVTAAKETYFEGKRTEQLVAEYTTEDNCCRIPRYIESNTPYDIKYCDGAKIAAELNENGIKYCEILNEYYTPEGTSIARLTYNVTTIETTTPNEININGTTIYMAPEGYTLNGNICEKETVRRVIKIVDEMPEGNYDNVWGENVVSAELIDVTIIPTKKYSEIIDHTLICDVSDSPVLNENGKYDAQLVLVPKTK